MTNKLTKSTNNLLDTLTIVDGADRADYFKIDVGTAGATTISTIDNDAETADLVINPDGDLIFEPEGRDLIYRADNGNTAVKWTYIPSAATNLILYEAGGLSSDDYFQITVGAGGTTMIDTVDGAGGLSADLQVNADGFLTLTGDDYLSLKANGGDITLDASTGIYKFKLDSDTDDLCTLTVAANGATRLATADSDGAVGHLSIAADGHVEFDNCAVGFDKLTSTFSTASITSEGNDSTDIDFRLGNKQDLTLTDNIGGSGENINMIFPATTGNFILVIMQDGTGSRTVASDGWKAYASDASLADNTLSSNGTDGDVRWAGGSAPTLTTAARGVDVISIYWDADEQTALAVASLGFEAP